MEEFMPADLRPQITAALLGREIFSAPALAHAGDVFLIVQRILPFEIDQWQALAGEEAGPMNKTWYYVIAGQYDSRPQAEIMVEQLRQQGLESFIVPAKAR